MDDAREIIEGVGYCPVSARYKIYIIDEVHMLSTSAFNALLKTLEEPPAHVKFIFATTEIRKVPVTILSRCQRFDLRRVPADELAGHLTRICERENINAEAEAVTAIAHEMRLRNLSGQIVIDFLAMKGKKDRQEVLTMLRNALAADPVECHVLGFTGLGMIELTRRRRGPSLTRLLARPGGLRPDPTAAALAALRAALARRGAVIRIQAAPDVAERLTGPLKDALNEANERAGGAIRVEKAESFGPGHYEITEG